MINIKRYIIAVVVTLLIPVSVWGWGVMGMTGDVTTAGGSVAGSGTWAGSWTEASQEGLTGFDYCVFFDSAVDSSNDTGYSANGVFSGASLVVTQNGAISGSTDSLTRKTDGVGDYFTINDGTVEYIASGSGASTWFFGWKVKSLLHPSVSNSMFRLSDTLTTSYLLINVTNAGRLNFNAVKPEGNILASTTADFIKDGANDTTYICFWYDGTDVRGGFMTGTTRPTKWTDFDSDSAVSTAGTWNADNFNANSIIVSQASSGVTANWYFFCADSDTVITN